MLRTAAREQRFAAALLCVRAMAIRADAAAILARRGMPEPGFTPRRNRPSSSKAPGRDEPQCLLEVRALDASRLKAN